MARPVTAREPRARRVDGAPFDSEGDAVAEKQPVADGAMHRIVVEVVAGIVAELESRVAAEDIEEVMCVPGVEHEAATSQRHRGREPARPGGRLLVAKFELDPDVGTEEIAEPAATTDLFVKLERVIVAHIRAEPADFELMCMLGNAEGWNGSETQREQCRLRSEEHTSELQSRVDISYAVF